MPDDTFVAATLTRYLALKPSMADIVFDLPRAQEQRVILREATARRIAGEGGAG